MDTMDTKKLFSWASTKIAFVPFVPFVPCVLDAVAQRRADRIFDE
jgi:hypothetical protein